MKPLNLFFFPPLQKKNQLSKIRESSKAKNKLTEHELKSDFIPSRVVWLSELQAEHEHVGPANDQWRVRAVDDLVVDCVMVSGVLVHEQLDRVDLVWRIEGTCTQIIRQWRSEELTGHAACTEQTINYD